MKHNEVRQFLKEANAAGLSPIEKDVFQYYFSRTQNESGEWLCPDAETAEDIARSRNGVCDARKKLIARGWIAENGQFNIKILKTFTVSNQTETGDSQSDLRLNTEKASLISDSSVSFQTQTDENSVSFQTPYIDKRNIGIQEKFKSEEAEAAPAAAALDDEIEIFDSNPFVATYQRYFDNKLKDKQKEIIIDRIRDGTIWLKTVQFWAGNDHKASSIGRMCEKYDELIEEFGEGENDNGINQQFSRIGNTGRIYKSKTNTEISQSRDYSDFDNFDHIATFAEN